jgi:hypothetical protein
MSESQQHHPFGPSGLHRLAQCPGSHFLSQGLPPEPESEYAAEGQMLHAAVAGNMAARQNLNSEQESLVERIHEFIGGLDLTQVKCERRLVLRDANGGELLFGTADLVAIDVNNPKVGYVVDWKFGRNPVPTPSLNLQAAAYAAAWAQEKSLQEIHAYIFQPRLEREPSSFTFTDLHGVTKTIEKIIERVKAPEKVFKSGDHCRWCPARAICPEIRKESALLVANAAMLQLTPDTAAVWHDMLVRVQAVAKETMAELKHFVIMKGSVPGLEVVERPGAREIDPEAGFIATHQVLTPDEFRACVKVQVGALEAAFVKAAQEKELVQTKKAGKALFESEVPWTKKPGTLVLRRKK